MEKLSLRLAVGFALAVLIPFLTLPAESAQSDLSVSNTAPSAVSLGIPFTVTVGYSNAGPDPAVSAYLNADFIPPMGLDVFLDNLFNGDGSIYAALQASAAGTDTNGNAPLLFWDDFFCENAFFQLQGDDTPEEATPMQPLRDGGMGAFTYELTLPMEAPRTGTIEITEPAGLAHAWTLVDSGNIWVEHGLATPFNRYSSTACSKLVGTEEEDVCQYIADNCWGARISQLDTPIEAQFELVNDGSADPTLGCEAFVGFTPGNIALIRRGTCQFGVKGFNAEQAGAVAVFMVNDGRCTDFPDNNDCVINMGAGDFGDLVSIPIAQVSFNDGEPVIAAIKSGSTIAGVFGSASTFATNSVIFLADSNDVDPDQTNDITATTSVVTTASVLIFIDGFESGDTGAWSQTSP